MPWHQLCSRYASDKQPFAITPNCGNGIVWDQFVACVFICFCPTDEWTSVLACDKGKPELLLRIIFLCIPLVVCLYGISASESSSNLIQHACIMFPYLYRAFSYQFILLTCLTIQHSTFVYLDLFLGSPSLLNLDKKLDESTLEYWMRAFQVKIYVAVRTCFSVHSGIRKLQACGTFVVVSCPDYFSARGGKNSLVNSLVPSTTMVALQPDCFMRVTSRTAIKGDQRRQGTKPQKSTHIMFTATQCPQSK